jgi:glutamate mutase epsilon subunit
MLYLSINVTLKIHWRTIIMEDNLVSELVRFTASMIPGKEIPLSIYYDDMKSKVLSNAKAKSLSAEDYIEEEFKNKLKNIENESQMELLEFGIDLVTVFIGDRRFRIGWVIDGYWEVYKKCTPTAKTTLDALTGW